MTHTAADIMTRNVVTAHPDDLVPGVAKLLSDHAISAVPVCDVSGRLVGMISEGDLMRPYGQAQAAKRSWWLALLAEGSEIAPAFLKYIAAERRTARDLMTKTVITAKPSTPLPALADLLMTHRIKRVPILRDGMLVGIVSRADLVKALARTPELVEALA
jgi:CBS domain-containing protein